MEYQRVIQMVGKEYRPVILNITGDEKIHS